LLDNTIADCHSLACTDAHHVFLSQASVHKLHVCEGSQGINSNKSTIPIQTFVTLPEKRSQP